MSENSYDVAVIGAGIVGCSIAWELINRGARVAVFDERAQPLQGSSVAGFGSLTPYSDPFFTGEAQVFAGVSVDLYRRKWLREITEKSGIDIPFVDLGLIELCDSEDDFEKAKKHAVSLLSGDRKDIAKLLTVSETRDLEPNLSDQFFGALWINEPWIDKDAYFRALEEILRRELRDNFHLNTRIQSVSQNGESLKLITNHNVTLNSQWVVSCTGLTLAGIEGLSG